MSKSFNDIDYKDTDEVFGEAMHRVGFARDILRRYCEMNSDATHLICEGVVAEECRTLLKVVDNLLSNETERDK